MDLVNPKDSFKKNWLLVIFTIITQLAILVLFLSCRWVPVFTKPTAKDCVQGTEAYGEILFTGDVYGRTGESGCSRLGTLAGRASLVRKFPLDRRLYLDFGNQLSDEAVKNRAEVPFLMEANRRMGLGALNITRRDLLKLADSGAEICGIPLVSANLRIRTRLTAGEVSGVSSFRLPRIVSHVVLPLRLCGGESPGDVVSVAVTGISGRQRVLHRGRVVVTAVDCAV